LIEKGSFFKLEDHIPFSSKEMSDKYKNGGLTLTFGKTKINYVEGMCVGGGSEINSGLYHRLPNEILKKWEKKNNIQFDRKFLHDSYDQNEIDLSISYYNGKIPKASQKLIEGSESLGWKCVEIPRWYKYNDELGVKQSMTQTFIPKFIENGGTLLTNTEVKKISKNGKSNIVHVISDGVLSNYECDFLFISAGSIDTPFLLRKSGFKGLVGKGLKTHPSFKLTAMFDEEIYSSRDEVSVHQIKEFSPEISMGCSVSNEHYLGMSLNDSNKLSEISNWKRMSSFYAMISPEGSGNVWKMPFFNSPFINYSLTSKDYYNIHKGIYLLSKLLFEAGAIRLFPSGNKIESICKLEDVYKINNISPNLLKLMTIHLFSSVQLSGSREIGPINIDGYLWDDDSIYINDGSILVDSPSVNPQGIIMALSRMNVLKFLNRIKNEV